MQFPYLGKSLSPPSLLSRRCVTSGAMNRIFLFANLLNRIYARPSYSARHTSVAESLQGKQASTPSAEMGNKKAAFLLEPRHDEKIGHLAKTTGSRSFALVLSGLGLPMGISFGPSSQ